MKTIQFSWIITLLTWLAFGSATNAAEKSFLHGCRGTYDNEPRLTNGHVDCEKLLSELTELRANTYNWLVRHKATDWDDLKTFLPFARKNKINVWVTIVPPTESSPNYSDSEPFKQDYLKWAEEIGKLSAKEKNLVAWSIDDFMSNAKTFSPEMLGKMLAKAHAANPQLAFVPCIYFRDVTPQFWKNYGTLLDAILFPYLAESGQGNLSDATKVESEIQKIKSIVGENTPVILDVYATQHSAHPQGSQPPYVREVMERGHRAADGVLIYCHQGKKENPEKFAIIKEQFHQWAKESQKK